MYFTLAEMLTCITSPSKDGPFQGIFLFSTYWQGCKHGVNYRTFLQQPGHDSK